MPLTQPLILVIVMGLLYMMKPDGFFWMVFGMAVLVISVEYCLGFQIITECESKINELKDLQWRVKDLEDKISNVREQPRD